MIHVPLEDGAHQCGVFRAFWLCDLSSDSCSLWMKEPSLLRASPSNGPMGKRAGILKEATLWKKLLDGRSTFLLNWSSSSNRDRERKKRNSIRCHPTERVPSSFVFILIFMYFTTISLYAYIVCLHIHIYTYTYTYIYL